MAKKLVIIGAGGDGRNVAEVVEEIGDKWSLLGFLDDDPNKQGIEINGVPVLGKIADIARYDNCHFIIVVGSPRDYFVRKRLATRLGNLTKKITIAAWSFSDKSYDKIKKAGGRSISIHELMKNNPKGENIRILG